MSGTHSSLILLIFQHVAAALERWIPFLSGSDLQAVLSTWTSKSKAPEWCLFITCHQHCFRVMPLTPRFSLRVTFNYIGRRQSPFKEQLSLKKTNQVLYYMKEQQQKELSGSSKCGLADSGPPWDSSEHTVLMSHQPAPLQTQRGFP